MKARVSFVLDTSSIADLEPSVEEVRALVMKEVVLPARVAGMNAAKACRGDPLDPRAVQAIRAMMVTLLVEANLVVEEVGDDTPFTTALPHENAL